MSAKINLEQLFIKTEQNTNRSLKSLIEKKINTQFQKGKLDEKDYRALGGKALIKSSITPTKVYEDPAYSYPHPIICHKCHKVDNVKLTQNKPGIQCYISPNSKNLALNIKVACQKCNTIKNSYIKKDSLPMNILSKVRKEEAKIKKSY